MTLNFWKPYRTTHDQTLTITFSYFVKNVSYRFLIYFVGVFIRGRVIRADFEKNAIETTSAQSPLKHWVVNFGCILAVVLSKCRI